MRYELTAEIMNEAWEEYKVAFPVPEHWSKKLGGTELSVIQDIVSTINYAGGPYVLLEIVEDQARVVLPFTQDVDLICARYWKWRTIPDGLAGFHLVLSDIFSDINNALAQLKEKLK